MAVGISRGSGKKSETANGCFAAPSRLLDAQVEMPLGRTLQVESVAYPVAACCFRVEKSDVIPTRMRKISTVNCPCQYRHHSYAYSYVLQQIRRVKGRVLVR